jgi:uncharacterized protein with PIN domain
MSWECAECHTSEEQGADISVVCHHCGKPLCRHDRVIIPDVVFAASVREAGAEAVHCRSCRREYHSKGDIVL